MRVIEKKAESGTLESGDIFVAVSPPREAGKTTIELKSPAKTAFGEIIEEEIRKITEELGVYCHIQAVDKGALGYTIRARTETAIRRALTQDKA